jgi:hypothetical protein
MPTTRSTRLTRRVLGLAVVPALALSAAACGGDDDDETGTAASFCEQAGELTERIGELSDPTSEEFREAIADLRDIEPPEEIAEDWDRAVEAFEAIAGLGDDEIDEDVLAQFDDPEFAAAGDRVDEYMTVECGVSP